MGQVAAAPATIVDAARPHAQAVDAPDLDVPDEVQKTPQEVLSEVGIEKRTGFEDRRWLFDIFLHKGAMSEYAVDSSLVLFRPSYLGILDPAVVSDEWSLTSLGIVGNMFWTHGVVRSELAVSESCMDFKVMVKRAVQLAASAAVAGRFYSLVIMGNGCDLMGKPFRALADRGEHFVVQAAVEGTSMQWVTNAPWILDALERHSPSKSALHAVTPATWVPPAQPV